MLLSNASLKCLLKGKSDTKICLKMIYLSRRTEITNRNRLLLLYFKRKLPEPIPQEKIPKASIIVKLRFTSNSIPGQGLDYI